ncbi:MAG: GTP pyrophosphokinase family protein [Lachnospiraceae bacterium]|nr:GTP pyrophosphokinase family protein [Lachnospiraceae bacterium]
MQMVEKQGAPFQRLMAYYQCAIMEVETKFKVLNNEFSLQYDKNPIETIKTRLKSPLSIIEKLNRKEIPFSIDAIEQNIFDVAGVRVICGFPEDIYEIADYFLRQDDIILIQRKDYIQNPKESGYRSLHLIIEIPIFLAHEKRMMKVEVQFRTIAMDFWASLEHKLKYKKNLGDDVEELSRQLKQCADDSAKLDLRMEEIRRNVEKQNRIQQRKRYDIVR